MMILYLGHFLLPAVVYSAWRGARIADADTFYFNLCIDDPALLYVHRNDSAVCGVDQFKCGSLYEHTNMTNVCINDPSSYAQRLANKWSRPYAVRREYRNANCNETEVDSAWIIKVDNMCHTSVSVDYRILPNATLQEKVYRPFGNCNTNNITSIRLYSPGKCQRDPQYDYKFYQLSYQFPIGTKPRPKPPVFSPWHSPIPTFSPEILRPSPWKTFFEGCISIFTSRIEFVIPMAILVVILVVAYELTSDEKKQGADLEKRK